MPALILVVNVNRTELRNVETLLSAAGYLVVGTSSFHGASKLLNSVIPDLLIADLMLGDPVALRGLHLAVLSQRDHPHLPVIVTHARSDADLESLAAGRQMTFVAKPLDNPDFLHQVATALGEQRSVETLIRKWPRKRVSSMRARLADALGELVDVSYGGLRLVLRSPPPSPDPMFDLDVPMADVTLKAARVWQSHARDEDTVSWGVKLLDTDSPATERWRLFVDLVAEAGVDASA